MAPHHEIRFFISYRRDDVDRAAHWIKGVLTQRFRNRADVFLDTDDLPRGTDYPLSLENRLNTCDVMIVIIGECWEKGRHNDKNIEDPADWIFHEIDKALERGIEIFPIWVNRDSVQYPKALRQGLKTKIHTKLSIGQLPEGNHELAVLFREFDRLADTYKRKPLAFVTSTLTYTGDNHALDGLDYFTTLMTLVLQSVNDQNFDVVLKVPQFSSDDQPDKVMQNQLRIISDVLDNSDNYRGLIVAPFEVLPLLRRLKRFRNENHLFPVAAIDKGFDGKFDGIEPLKLQPLFSAENDNYFNGELAAKCFVEYVRQARITKGNVVVMQGREGSQPRIEGFTNYLLREEFANLKIKYTITDPMDFTKQGGHQAALDYLDPAYLQDCFGPEREEQVHGFFCCNDEIALGVRLALEENIAAIKAWEWPVVVIGFDAIRDFTVLLERENERFLLNTIYTRIILQVSQLVEMLSDFINRRPERSKQPFLVVQGTRQLDPATQRRRTKQILKLHRTSDE